jgi:hypothetical protein
MGAKVSANLRRFADLTKLTPDVMSIKMVEASYIDLSKYTKETENHFTEHFIQPLIQIALLINNPQIVDTDSNETKHSSMSTKVSIPCKPATICLIDDYFSGTVTDTKWPLASNILMGAVELICGRNHEGLNIHFFHNASHNRDAITNSIAAYEVLYNWSPPKGGRSNSPFKREMLPLLDNWRNGVLTPINLVVLADMKPKDRFYDLEDIMADIVKSDVHEMAKELLHIQICHVGHNPGTKHMFQKLTERVRSRLGTDRFGRPVSPYVWKGMLQLTS